MKTTSTSPSIVRVFRAAGIAILIVVLLLAGFRLITGKSLGVRSLAESAWRAVTSPFKGITNSQTIKAGVRGEYTNIIFLHHSTGNNLIQQGNVRVSLGDQGYDLWDHGFNRQGLRDPDSVAARYNYSVPNDSTDPDGLAAIFKQSVLPLPLNALTSLLQHEVIVLKSCFEPANHIRSDEQLEEYKTLYVGIREGMAKHPDRIFILLTTPPLNPAETNPDEAARARKYAEWLMSDEFKAGQPNIFVFDFYSLLAESDPGAADYNMLRASYRDGSDSHPNQAANIAVGPIFTDFVIQSIQSFRSAASAN